MSRYIDADKFKDFMDVSFEAVGLMAPVSASLVMEIKEYVKNQIDGQPTADVRSNVHGEWIDNGIDPDAMDQSGRKGAVLDD